MKFQEPLASDAPFLEEVAVYHDTDPDGLRRQRRLENGDPDLDRHNIAGKPIRTGSEPWAVAQ